MRRHLPSLTGLLLLGMVTALFAADRPIVRTVANFTVGPEPEIFASIEPFPDGGAVLAGFTSSIVDDQMNAYAARIDASGEVIWETVTGDSLSEEFYKAVPTSDGGVLAVGTSNSYGDKVFDFYVVRFDGDGNELWYRSLGGIPFDVATGVHPHPGGGWYIAGFHSNPDNQFSDFRIAHVDETAENVLWNTEPGGPAHEFLITSVPDGEGGLICAGSTHSFDAENRDGYVVRIDSEGQVIWQVKPGGPWPDIFNDMVRTPEGQYVLVGTTHRNPDSEESDIWVVRLGLDGTVLSELVVGGDSWDEAWGITQLEDRGFFVVGNTFDPQAGVKNGYGIRLDEDLNILWSLSYGDNDGYQEFRDVIPWGEETVMAVGYTSSTDEGDADFLMQQIDVSEQWVTGSRPTRPDKEFMVDPANPNPFNASTSVVVTLPWRAELEVAVFNLLGQRVATLTRGRYAAGMHRFTWHAVREASGTYVIEARANGRDVARQRVLLVK